MLVIYFLLSCLSILLLYLGSDRATEHLTIKAPFSAVSARVKRIIGIIACLIISVLLILHLGTLKGLITFGWWFFLITSCYILFLPTTKWFLAPSILCLTALFIYII